MSYAVKEQEKKHEELSSCSRCGRELSREKRRVWVRKSDAEEDDDVQSASNTNV